MTTDNNVPPDDKMYEYLAKQLNSTQEPLEKNKTPRFSAFREGFNSPIFSPSIDTFIFWLFLFLCVSVMAIIPWLKHSSESNVEGIKIVIPKLPDPTVIILPSAAYLVDVKANAYNDTIYTVKQRYTTSTTHGPINNYSSVGSEVKSQSIAIKRVDS